VKRSIEKKKKGNVSDTLSSERPMGSANLVESGRAEGTWMRRLEQGEMAVNRGCCRKGSTHSLENGASDRGFRR